MSKIKQEVMDYLERHNLSEIPEGVTFDDVYQDNLKAKENKW